MTLVSAAQRRPSRPRVDFARAKLAVLLDELREKGHDRLPSEAALSADFGVSRNTLREALAQLEAEGSVQRKRRVGTLITKSSPREIAPETPRSIYPLDRIVSILDFLKTTGGSYEVNWVTVRQEIATPEVAEAVGLPVDTEVFLIRRKYVKDGVGVAIGEHWIPRVLRGKRIEIEGLSVGVTTYLEDSQHIEIGRVEHTVSATTADTKLARELGVLPGTALLVVYAKLQEEGGSTPETIAIGKLTFNPAVVSLHATANPTRDDAKS